MQQGQMPGQEMAEGLLLLIAGVLLVTPGFITDIIGFLFALPVTRPILARSLMSQFAGNISMHTSFQGDPSHNNFQQSNHHQPFNEQGNRPETQRERQGNVTIEGEFQKKD